MNPVNRRKQSGVCASSAIRLLPSRQMPNYVAFIPQMKFGMRTGETLSPGFVNAHTHLYGVLAHGIPLDRAPSDFWAFLKDFGGALVEDRLDHEMICAATDHGCVEMLRSRCDIFLRLP